AAEARTIFLDWAMSAPPGDPVEQISLFLDHYGAANPHHPMTAVLREGLTARARQRRRGRSARR
ncbi:MAG: hypothetical protein ACPGID_11195, partial [Rubricella sp.]